MVTLVHSRSRLSPRAASIVSLCFILNLGMFQPVGRCGRSTSQAPHRSTARRPTEPGPASHARPADCLWMTTYRPNSGSDYPRGAGAGTPRLPNQVSGCSAKGGHGQNWSRARLLGRQTAASPGRQRRGGGGSLPGATSCTWVAPRLRRSTLARASKPGNAADVQGSKLAPPRLRRNRSSCCPVCLRRVCPAAPLDAGNRTVRWVRHSGFVILPPRGGDLAVAPSGAVVYVTGSTNVGWRKPDSRPRHMTLPMGPGCG